MGILHSSKATAQRDAAEGNIARLFDAVNSVIRGKPEAVRESVITLLAGGHLLIEDVPGVGKTTLARALAHAMGGEFRRLQFTSDLLPSDILGVNVFDPASRHFRFRPGPVFCHVLLADEINRTTPRTQSALLQAMEERHVSLDGTNYPLPEPFLVIATQNPLEHHGTYPLPESQMDRFLMRISMGYPTREAELELIAGGGVAEALEAMPAALSPQELIAARRQILSVRIEASILEYLLQLVERTRDHPDLQLGASPRASQALGQASRAAAFLAGRDYTLPEDVKAIVDPVLSHRILPRESAGDPAAQRALVQSILSELVGSVPVPL